MSVPQRIQLRRTKGWKMPSGTVNVARPGRFGNPFKVGGMALPSHVVREHREWLFGTPDGRAVAVAAVEQLHERDVACWCPLTYPGGTPHPCHGDTLLALANCPEAAPVIKISVGEDYCWGGKRARCSAIDKETLGRPAPEIQYTDGSGGGLWMGVWMGMIYPVGLLDVLDGKEVRRLEGRQG